MATTATFGDMLNEYLPNELLREELNKRSWVMQNVEQDETWAGGTLVVPFEAAGASSVKFAGLTAVADISQDNLQRGTITTQPELWGSFLIYQKDIWHHGKLSEQSLLKILPDRVDNFMDYFKDVLSLNALNGTVLATVTDATNAATGIMVVNRIERFKLGQAVSLDDDNDSAQTYYVTAINKDTKAVTLSLTSGGAAANVATYTVAQNAKFYWIGSQSTGMSSIRAALLSSANGGSSSLFGKTKTAYPFLQAYNADGSGITGAANILDKIFDAFTETRQRGSGLPDTCLMSYKNFGSVLKALEVGKGGFHQDQKSTKTSVYGWTEVVVFGPAGSLKIVVLKEIDDDVIFFLDMRPSAIKMYSNGGVRKRVAPDGKEYFESRDATAGYSYVIDVAFMGDLVVQRPSSMGCLYGISY